MTDPLPPGWALTEVGKICKVEYGKGLSKKQRVETGEVEVFGSAGFSGYHDTSLVDEPIVIVGRKGNAGRVWVTQGPSWPIDTTYFLRPPHAISPKYLSLQLGHLDLVKKDSSTTIPSLRRPDLEATQINLAPLVEQQRIVAAVEEHFSSIDAAESAAQTALARLETLRRAILTAAFSGHLVEPFHLNQTSANHTLSWIANKLSDLLDYTIGGIWGSKPGEEEVDVDVIRVTELTLNGGLNTATAARRSVTNKQYMSRLLKQGDILLEKSGGGPTTPVGRVALFDYHHRPAICTNFMQLMRPKAFIRSKFLFWQLHLWHIQGRTARLQKGSSNIRNLQTKQYLVEVILYPNLMKQDKIIAIIEEHFSRLDAAKASIERCLQRCAVLRRAVLAAAFSGRLVEQDPSDEPASILLERIAVEQPKRRTRRKSA